MNMKKFKAKYISDIPSIFLEKGKVYDVFQPKDDKRFLAVMLEDIEEPGYYAIPADSFEIIE